jgi:adenylate cyclase
MFVDLEGSTSIAERLGHTLFCQLIQECFRDLGEIAMQRGAEIYQYVGDEAILTWNPSRGLSDGNCLRLFFDFENALRRREQFYRERFGVTPEFKAGANIGPATVAEIGVVKRDIAYLSDVLNTAARLQSMCREFQASLLITDSLHHALPETNDLLRERVGNVSVRGKSKQVEIYSVELRHAERA